MTDYDPNAPHDTQPADSAAPADAPKDAVDAQTQAYVEHAEDMAKVAEHEAELAKERAEHMNDTAEPKEGEAEKDERPRDAFGGVIVQPSDIVVRTGPRTVDMVVKDEDTRLLMLKDQIKAHLRNATPDMTGGLGEESLDAQTGLPAGHVPEGGPSDPGSPPALQR